MIGAATRSLARNTARLVQPLASTSRLAAASPAPLARAALVAPTLRNFGTTRPLLGAGESDVELSSRLAHEIAFEKENNASVLPAPDAEPEFVTKFKQTGIWKIDDKPGMDEIILSREFGNEHIRILVSIGDIDTTSADPTDLDAHDGQDGAAPHDGVDPDHPEDDPSSVAAFPVRMAITISKPNRGAMTFEAVAADGEMSIDNITFLRDNKMAEDLTVEADWARRGVYVGPQFDTLDEGVQEQFENFLVERGIDQDLALFIPNFAEYKEQKEYCQWLENVKDFVDA
ncbi:uncharacterized protein PFL1_06785 [Pseudozyma flocculosa PF-1]|uniref:Related to Mrb1 - Mitochondrial p32 Family Protein n=2 Tax=Pseudozyma flocculosa TaxID=84751 RepID=A0A5C3FED2_9BASI|nr:uncharacterized protein PFL1_06785 [Pseudozyma flocculosa PF-1]EPQ25648.1 hypothetical protein PFL1_06785 [Pseudozyma flocculosa PF-1]SPO42055.1 related to Mrb1 - Mitochondrial p32 Family Protein [Pseudozyma flocculosa]